MLMHVCKEQAEIAKLKRQNVNHATVKDVLQKKVKRQADRQCRSCWCWTSTICTILQSLWRRLLETKSIRFSCQPRHLTGCRSVTGLCLVHYNRVCHDPIALDSHLMTRRCKRADTIRYLDFGYDTKTWWPGFIPDPTWRAYSTLPDLAGGEEDSYSGFNLWVLRPRLASAMLILCRRHCHSAVRIRCSWMTTAYIVNKLSRYRVLTHSMKVVKFLFWKFKALKVLETELVLKSPGILVYKFFKDLEFFQYIWHHKRTGHRLHEHMSASKEKKLIEHLEL